MRTIIYFIFLVIFLLIATPLFAVVWVLTAPFDKKKICLKYASVIYSRGIILACPFWKIKVSGKENLPKDKPFVMCTNHRSMIDIPLINTLNINFRWVAKREVLKIPIFFFFLYMRGDITIDRGGTASTKKMFRQCKKEIAQGVSISVFFF